MRQKRQRCHQVGQFPLLWSAGASVLSMWFRLGGQGEQLLQKKWRTNVTRPYGILKTKQESKGSYEGSSVEQKENKNLNV